MAFIALDFLLELSWSSILVTISIFCKNIYVCRSGSALFMTLLAYYWLSLYPTLFWHVTGYLGLVLILGSSL